MSGLERIDIGSWGKAGRGFVESSTDFGGAAASGLAGMSVDELGCNNGGTLADSAFAIVIPTMLEALRETAEGISEGLRVEGSALTATGRAYAAAEAENAAQASGMV